MSIADDMRDGSPQAEKPRFNIRDAAFALQPQPPLDWIIERLICAGGVSLFYGDPGTKKTYAMLSLAVCVALGKPWLGFPVKPRRVLFLDEESGERRLTMRLGAAIRGEQGNEETPILYVSLAGFKLDDGGDSILVEALIEETEAGLVVFDALADIMDGDENSKQDTQPVFTACRRIAERTGAAVIIVHHSNRNGGYRGSSAIKGALDLMVKIESDNGSGWINFVSEKTRDGEAIDWAAVATWNDDQFYLKQAEILVKAKKLNLSQSYVMDYVTKHRASPLPEIMGAADRCSPNAARLAVYSLTALKKLYRTNPNEKGKGAVAIYDLANESPANEE